MNKAVLLSLLITISLLVSACSGGSDPAQAQLASDDSQVMTSAGHLSQTHLWGFYDVCLDVETGEMGATLNRHAMFTANVVNFINNKPGALSFKINAVIPNPSYTDIDIDVSITHPFPGLTQYNGYDVRGVFMGDGSASLNYQPALIYPVQDVDQFMLADSDDGFGGPDGYTRWYNAAEFSEGGMPLFNYTPGKFASSGYTGTATLCPYKYFADTLGATDDLWTWLGENADLHGVFSSGAKNTRNNYLRFPSTKGIEYSYAIIANWEGTDAQFHPSNAPEAVACNVADSSDLWYVSPTQKGGSIKLDISLWDWDSMVSAGVMEDYRIFVESTVLNSVHAFNTSEMTPIGGGDQFSTYSVEILADNITGNQGNEYWVIAECADETYENNLGVPNLAGTDKLAALFRYDLAVTDVQGNLNPSCDLVVVTPMPKEGFGPQTVEFDASGSSDPEGKPLSYEWDFDGDSTFSDAYNSGTDAHPFKAYNTPYAGPVCVRVSDPDGGSSECCDDVDVDPAPSKNLPLRDDKAATDLAVDPNNGNLLVLYEDGQVWKYTESTRYSQSSATYLFTADIPTSPWNPIPRVADYRLDIAPSGNIIAAGYSGMNGWPAGVWNSSGSKLDTAPGPGAGDTVPDLFSFQSGGSYGNTQAFLCPGNEGWQNNLYRWAGGWQQHYETPGENASTGYDMVKFSQVTGCVAVSGSQFWVIEDTPDYYASKWALSGWFHSFDGEWFGTGSQDDSDLGWYSAKDLTVDSDGYFYVLDQLASGQGRIKVFQSGSPGTALTDHAAGDIDTISEAPLRIEGTTYVSPDLGNLIFVLHGDAIPSKLSIFFPSDLGW